MTQYAALPLTAPGLPSHAPSPTVPTSTHRLRAHQAMPIYVQEAPPIPRRLPFDPPAFDPAKLTVVYLNGAIPLGPQPLAARRYTLTHSDITGQLLLSVGRQYNQGQLSGASATCHDAREQLMNSTRQTMSQVTGVTLCPIAYSG